MPEGELFLLFVRPLNLLGIRYIIGGSVASIFYGEPRLTHDIDFVVYLSERDVQRLAAVFPTPDFYFPPIETVLGEVRRDQQGDFNIIHTATGFNADMYLGGRDGLNAWGFRMRRQIQFENETVILAPPEYVVVRKLEYYREGGSEKHLRDIRSILTISKARLDLPALQEWVGRLGLESQWRKVAG
jgi:hypothetical protein